MVLSKIAISALVASHMMGKPVQPRLRSLETRVELVHVPNNNQLTNLQQNNPTITITPYMRGASVIPGYSRLHQTHVSEDKSNRLYH